MLRNDESIRWPKEDIELLEAQKKELVEQFRISAIDSVANLIVVVDRIERIGRKYEDLVNGLYGKCASRRLTLEFKRMTVLKLEDYPTNLERQIIEELEMLGFSYPTDWATMSLSLAYAEHLWGHRDTARAIRQQVHKNLVTLRERITGMFGGLTADEKQDIDDVTLR